MNFSTKNPHLKNLYWSVGGQYFFDKLAKNLSLKKIKSRSFFFFFWGGGGSPGASGTYFILTIKGVGVGLGERGLSDFLNKTLTKNPNLKKVLGGEGGWGKVRSKCTSTNVSNDTSTLQGEQLCQIIQESIHKCRS